MENKIALSDWQQIIKKRRDSLIRSSLIIEGFDKNQNILGFDSKFDSLVVVENKKLSFYINKAVLKQLVKASFQKLNKKYFDNFKNTYQQLSLELELEISHLPQSQEKLKELDNKTLYRIIHHFFQVYRKFAIFMIAPHIFQVSLTDRLTTIFEQKGLDSEKILVRISTPLYETFEEKFQKGLLALADKRRAKKNINKEIEQFVHNWEFYLTENYAFLEKLDKPKILKMVDEILKSNRSSAPIDNGDGEDDILNSFNLDDNTKTLILFLRYLIWLRTERLLIFRKAYFYSLPLILEVLRRMYIGRDYISVLTYKEIEKFLITGMKINQKELNKRLNKTLLLYFNGKMKVITNPKGFGVWSVFFNGSENQDLLKLKGWSASTGKVIGKARIILDKRDLNNFEKGDVLVTNMTNPDYVTIMRRAAAIITDEGGVTCHAAIVSRELGVPCIVGTQIATDVLKDGDLVEVDATKGVVRILNRIK